jgi:hypothetical protein
MRRLAILAAALPFALPAFAHHSDAAHDMSSLVTIKGHITEFYLRNPHAYFSVATRDEQGNEVEWAVQMASGLTLSRRGWRPESLTIGEEVTVELHPARDGKPYGLIVSVVKANGSSLPNVGAYGRTRTSSETVVARATSIEGTWIVDRESLGDDYPGGLDQLMRRDLVLTQAGRAAEAAFRIEDDPLLRCIGRPTPGDIVYTDLYPLQIKFNADDTLTIRSQFFDEQRIVYMDGRPHPAANERFHEGIGRARPWWWIPRTLPIIDRRTRTVCPRGRKNTSCSVSSWPTAVRAWPSSSRSRTPSLSRSR